jgi:hypothetical protein
MKRLFKHGLMLSTFIIALVFSSKAQSTQVVVTLNDGTEQNYAMTEADRMYFEDNTILVIEMGEYKNTVKIPLADIRKLTCLETEGTNENNATALSIFPNPVHDALVIRNLQGSQTVNIYALDGRLMKTFTASGEQAIDISDLAMGIYLVKTESATLKMIKL